MLRQDVKMVLERIRKIGCNSQRAWCLRALWQIEQLQPFLNKCQTKFATPVTFVFVNYLQHLPTLNEHEFDVLFEIITHQIHLQGTKIQSVQVLSKPIHHSYLLSSMFKLLQKVDERVLRLAAQNFIWMGQDGKCWIEVNNQMK